MKIVRGFAGDKLSWTNVATNNGYTIERNVAGTLSYVDIPLNITTFALDNENFGNKYRIRTKGGGRYSDSDYSVEVTYTEI